jgi:hypothetical protein
VTCTSYASYAGHIRTSGVVHRDLKPGNVVIAADDGTATLLDFGIAHLTDPDATRYTALGATPGSAGYMAPEQLRGQQDVSAAVDLYAFGCVLFELLTGEKPFEDKPDRNKDVQHLEDLPPRVRDIDLGIPEDLDDLVWDLLGKTPADRPAGIGEALAALRGHLPALGDPGPDPELHPDPTARYRLGGAGTTVERAGPMGQADPAGRAGPSGRADHVRRGGSRRSVRRRGPWLGRGEFADLIALARSELAATGPGAECERLASVLARAVPEWGLQEPAVAEAYLMCGDAARLDGCTGRAKELYEKAAALGDLQDPRRGALTLEARLGVAECRIPEGDLRTALEEWHRTASETLGLTAPPAHLVERCREVALELSERGFGAEVSSLVRRLAEV